MTPKLTLIIGIAAAMGVFAPVASAVGSGSEIEYPGGYPQSGHGYLGHQLASATGKKKPATVKPGLVLQTRIEGSQTFYRFGNGQLWMQ